MEHIMPIIIYSNQEAVDILEQTLKQQAAMVINIYREPNDNGSVHQSWSVEAYVDGHWQPVAMRPRHGSLISDRAEDQFQAFLFEHTARGKGLYTSDQLLSFTNKVSREDQHYVVGVVNHPYEVEYSPFGDVL